MRPLQWLSLVCFSGATCVTALANERSSAADRPIRPASWSPPPAPPARAEGVAKPRAASTRPAATAPIEARLEHRSAPAPAERDLARAEMFSNTYYDFPAEPDERADTPLYDVRCQKIADVARVFHDRVCVQGSGRLASGQTVSFASRDCPCAEECPRTGQRICFEALDPRRFPSGRGARGQAITPLRTVAVDPAVIPLGTALFIPELAGLPQHDGSLHDGCFLAEDQGLLIKGKRIDVFAGDELMRLRWDASVPSHRGVHVLTGDARCAARFGSP